MQPSLSNLPLSDLSHLRKFLVSLMHIIDCERKHPQYEGCVSEIAGGWADLLIDELEKIEIEIEDRPANSYADAIHKFESITAWTDDEGHYEQVLKILQYAKLQTKDAA